MGVFESKRDAFVNKESTLLRGWDKCLNIYHINPLFEALFASFSFTNTFKRSKSFTMKWLAKALQLPSFETNKGLKWMDINDTQTGVPFRILRGARCVQRFDDSLNSAIHITYRISLRSSSMREPRDPLLKVIFYFSTNNIHMTGVREKMSTSV